MAALFGAGGLLESMDLRDYIRQHYGAKTVFVPLRELCRLFEAEVVSAIIESTGGNLTRAAAIMGVHRNRLRDKLRDMERLGVACTRQVKPPQARKPGKGIWQSQ